MTTNRLMIHVLALVGVAMCSAVASAQDRIEDQDRLAQFRATYVLKILPFIEWPKEKFDDRTPSDQPEPNAEQTLAPIVVTVLGRDSYNLEGYLERAFARERVGGRRITLRTIAYPVPPPEETEVPAELMAEFRRELRESHVLYITQGQRRRMPEVLDMIDGADVLTISDIFRFAEDGGMIGLSVRENRLAIDANVAAIQKSNVVVSSRFLRLARIVNPSREQSTSFQDGVLRPWFSMRGIIASSTSGSGLVALA